MRTTGRSSGKRSAAASPTKPPPGSGHPQPQQHMPVNPAAMQALMYAQHPQGWAGIDPLLRAGYAPGPFAHYPTGAGIPAINYAGAPGMMAASQFQAQQALALQQAQFAQQAHLAQQARLVQQAHLTQQAYGQQQFLQLVHPPMDIVPPEDNFVYVQPEVQKVVDEKVMEAIRKRALFVAPPLGRLRIPQACERCRKRKTKCTGEKPTCKRCEKRGVECEYVFEHRANKTKKAVAEREEAARVAEEVALLNGEISAVYGDPSAMTGCPPAGPTWSSSSGYSAASASSLPPPNMLAGPPGPRQYPHGAPTYSSLPGYSLSSLESALPTPAIMLEGRPLISANVRSQAPPAPPPSRSRAGSRAKRPTPVKSTGSLQAISRSTSAMSVQHSDMPIPPALPSCEACLNEMANCNECDMDRESMHTEQRYTTDHEPRSPPIPIDSILCGPFPPSPPLEVKQQLLDAVNRALAKQAAERSQGASPTGSMMVPSGPPTLTRDGSSSASGSDGQSNSGLQTPHDYFTYPGSTGMSSGPDTLSPSAYNTGGVMVKTSESMAAAEEYQGMCGSSPGGMQKEPERGCDGQGEVQFSDYFHSFDPSTPDSMRSICDEQY